MKKNRVLLLVIVALLCVLVGFVVHHKTTNASFNNESIDNTVKEMVNDNPMETSTQANSELVLSENFETEILSDEDKMVKVEINKHIDTDVDFRNNKKEIINGKTFAVTFSKADPAVDYERIIYTNDHGDEFAYNTYSGKLRYAIMDSLVIEKNVMSIDKTTAQKIATEYFSTKCNIEEYIIDYFTESKKGYYFCFTRYICGYPSSDTYGIKVGYDGNIVYINDYTCVFEGKKMDYSKEFIDSKIKEHSEEMNVDWESVTICINEEGNVSVKYAMPKQNAIAILPLE